jgi:hypothetical protein
MQQPVTWGCLLAGQVHSRMMLHADDEEAGDSPQHACKISQFQTVHQLVYFAAITALSGVLAGKILHNVTSSPLLQDYCVALAEHEYVQWSCAGLLGVSGGMLLVPLLLEFGLMPQVASATSMVIVLCSTSAAAISFAISGKLDIQAALLFSSLCLAAATVGMLFIGRYVQRTGKVGTPAWPRVGF